VLNDGKRAILDVLVPGDIVGLDHVLLARPASEIIAANRVTYNELDPTRLRSLMADPRVALSVMALLAEARWRSDRLSATIGRLDAEARLAALIVSIHDRLRGRGLINHLSFNLPLTQEQIADHLGLTLVHVNRTLRRMREERLVVVDRQVVMIMDLEGLRTLTRGLP
jgi:CRP-like cAMP-binding protein